MFLRVPAGPDGELVPGFFRIAGLILLIHGGVYCWMLFKQPEDCLEKAENTEDHNFGYTCHLPNVTIDNITVYRGTALTVFSNFSNKDITSQTTKNPVAIGGRLTITNNTNGYSFTTSANSTVRGAYTVYYD